MQLHVANIRNQYIWIGENRKLLVASDPFYDLFFFFNFEKYIIFMESKK